MSMKLTPDEHVKIKEWLYNKGVKKCPMCNNSDIYKHYRGPVEMVYTDKYNLNAIQLTCPSCFYTMLFELPLILGEMDLESLVGSE